MTNKHKQLILGVVTLCALPAASQAQVLLSENFNALTPAPFTTATEAVGPEFTASHFRIAGPTAGNCTSPASGSCIVLQNATGSLTSIPVTLEAGKAYFLSFDILGNGLAGGTSVTNVTLGSVFDQTFTLTNSPRQTEMVNEVIRPTSNITTDLIFHGAGVSRTAGMFIDNVRLAVPEPATLGLMVLGLLGAGFAGRKRRN
jgi:hypothetical protein